MRSWIAALRTLVLPWGTTSGQRIVLDGVNGIIEFYGADGSLFLTIDPTTGLTVFSSAASGSNATTRLSRSTGGAAGALRMSTGRPEESTPGFVSVTSLAGIVLRTTVTSPRQSDEPSLYAAINLDSEATPGSRNSRIELEAQDLGIDPDMVDAAAGPVGAIVGRIELLDGATNNVLGYLPVYDTIA